MTTSTDPLLLATLALDSYNRGYGEGIVNLGGLNSQIGSATLVQQSDTGNNTPGVNAGFYAAAYKLDDGSIVIAYRGTDHNGLYIDALGGCKAAYAQRLVNAMQWFTGAETNHNHSRKVAA